VPIAAGWVDAVMEHWRADEEINFTALETEWRLRPLEIGETSTGERRKAMVSITGFEDLEERARIVAEIEAAGGGYSGDLKRDTTHLIVYKPEGKKYHAAKAWGIHRIGVEWLRDCVERGMILEETLYDPTLPPAERGKGAWRKALIMPRGKRSRENSSAGQAEGRRKLRKTASMRALSQNQGLWGDILGNTAPSAEASPAIELDEVEASTGSTNTVASLVPTTEQGVFSGCIIYIHGFPSHQTSILTTTVLSMGGTLIEDAELEASAAPTPSHPGHRLIIVPQRSQPSTHPDPPPGFALVTEFYVERCLHKRHLFDPRAHALGRPFAVFPIAGFEKLVVCTGGFAGVDLNHADKAVRQLGARYEERFTAQCSLLLVPELAAVRRAKIEMAVRWRVPVVHASWLWSCITQGKRLPIAPHLVQGLAQDHLVAEETPLLGITARAQSTPPPDTATGQTASQYAATVQKQDSDTAMFETAPTHQDVGSRPLSEASENSLNQGNSTSRRPLHRVASEVADSQGTSAFSRDLSPEQENESAPDERAVAAALEKRELTTKLNALVAPTTATTGPTAAAPGRVAPQQRKRKGLIARAVSTGSVESASTSLLAADSLEDGGTQPPVATQLAYADEGGREALLRKLTGQNDGTGLVDGEKVTLRDFDPRAGARKSGRRR
jgi:DNA replication regulator DPB11